MSVLRLILGDQLSTSLSSLRDYQSGDTLLMCELKQETQYVRHHKKKLVFVLSAMRHFSNTLQKKGFCVRYYTLDDRLTSFTEAVHTALRIKAYNKVIVTHPGEWRVLTELKAMREQLRIPLEIREDDRLLCTQEQFAHWADGKKQLRMEFFYREMRKRYRILMDDNKPVGGDWNYDSQNRKSLPDDIQPPEPCQFKPDRITQQVIRLVDKHFPHNFGSTEGFSYGVTQRQAEKVLNTFIEQRLGLFGDYQDAMKANQPWLFHSHLGLYLNIGLLTPAHVIHQAEAAYRKGLIPLNAAEGFIRQILGWREFVRGIYWLKMPDYAKLNSLHATRHLPDFYWHGKTKMQCLSECVNNTRDNAYAHHIQRLMVLGNFSLLAGINPSEVNRWFLEVYADAYEWVELPNVSGMTLFADGGMLASKPYASGGSYINRMSDYCRHCQYNVKEKTGENACPFNYLYWDFLDRNRYLLKPNPRLALPYKNLDRMSDRQKEEFRDSSRVFLVNLDNNQTV